MASSMASSTPSSYTVHIGEASEQSELDAIVDVIWAAMDGVDPSHQVFYPTFGDSPTARADAIAESKLRLWHEHTADPASHWIYAREAEGGRIVGGCQWRFYDENPFPNGPPTIIATWWPEGVGRDFASECVKQCFTPRTVWMARPHAGLSLMCVRPEVQRRGVGKSLMAWGLAKADERGLETFIEATGPGRFLYERCGFVSVKEVKVNMEGIAVEKGEEWVKLEREKLPIGYTAMWRPSGGVYISGELEKTWNDRLKSLTAA